MQLHLLPHIHRQYAGVEFGLQPLAGLAHPQVIELDAFALRGLLAVPVGFLETPLRIMAGLTEQAVVAIEAFDQGLRDGKGPLVGQRIGKHRLGCAVRHHWASAGGSA